MHKSIQQHFQAQLDQIQADGLFKTERIITGPQRARITVQDGREVLNMCANNYLGLAAHPEVIAAADDVTASVVDDGCALELERWF